MQVLLVATNRLQVTSSQADPTKSKIEGLQDILKSDSLHHLHHTERWFVAHLFHIIFAGWMQMYVGHK